jgi:ATP-dependent RNA helicase DeaD
MRRAKKNAKPQELTPAEKKEREEHVVEPEDALPEVTLRDLPDAIRKAAERAGWDELMPVQAKTLPYILAGRDMMVQSRTGSGKTGAFVMPILHRIEPKRNETQAMVLVPTRELAGQVYSECKMLAGDSGVRSVAVYGGVGYGPQIDAFKKGAHIVVGTPGRILDHLLRGTLKLDGLEILVFDEADRMLSMGFYPDMKEIKRYLPRRLSNAYMFSATFPPHVMALAGEFLTQPQMLSLSRDVVHVPQTEQAFYNVAPMEKDRALVRLIEVENPTSALIFCNTKQMVHYVSVVLKRFGYDADELSADLPQKKREKLLQRLKQARLKFLVATDLAARGLDIPALSHVIQYEPPEDPEAYIHRAGRTGRAGASGVNISLVSGEQLTQLRRIAARYEIDLLEKKPPSEADVQRIVSERLLVALEARLRNRDRVQVERMQRFAPLAEAIAEGDDHSIMSMLLDDYYQETLQSPQQAPEPVDYRPPSAKKSPEKRRPRRRPKGGDSGSSRRS